MTDVEQSEADALREAIERVAARWEHIAVASHLREALASVPRQS